MSWNILCPACGGVLDSGATLKTVKQAEYTCVLCAEDCEPTLDEIVEVTFTISPRVRKIAAHDPETLSFIEYYRQVFWSSGVDLPEDEVLARWFKETTLDAVELSAGDKVVLSLQLPEGYAIVFDPVLHMVSCGLGTVPSLPSTSQVRAQAPARVLLLATLTRRRLSRDATLTQAMWLTASCALRTELSPRLMLRTRAQAPARALLFLPAFVSTPPGRSRQLQLTLAMSLTACCALQTARSPCSMLRERAQVLAKALSRSASTRQEPLRESMLTRAM